MLAMYAGEVTTMAYYEERRVVLQPGALPAYRRLVHEALWPALAEAGARPLCLLSGLIGAPVAETYLFTGFPDAEAWVRAQPLLGGTDPEAGRVEALGEQRASLIVEERARLLVDCGVRPKAETPLGDRRAVYGLRRFWIRPADWPAFVRQSSEGIWPRIETQDACILGMFRDAAITDPLEAVLITGYHSPAHWQETRGHGETAPTVSEALREGSRRAGTDRNALTLRSYVYLMTAHWPA
ncbi:MAG: hypothetical protein ACRDJE_23310 [Dehalococcoidia bacterium]